MFLRTLMRCYELYRNQWLEPEPLRKLQEKRLRAIVKHAYETVPLYHEKFRAANIKPGDIQSIEDSTKIPFVTKQEIKSGIPDSSICNAHCLDEYLWISTSGTSGGPMPVFYDKRFMEYCLANWYYRTFAAIGLKPWDTAMIIEYLMPDPKIFLQERLTVERAKFENKTGSVGRTALGRTGYSLFGSRLKKVFIVNGEEDVISNILKFKPTLLNSNPSFLRLIAEKMEETGTEVHPKVVRTSGEVTDEATMEYLESAFNCPVYDEYSTWDFAFGAWQCTKKEGYHIDADLLTLEVIRDDEQATPGELGEIVVTGFMNSAMPMIRYRTGDAGVLGKDACSCGRGFPLLESVEGRMVDFLKIPHGRLIPPKAIMAIIQRTLGVSRFQVRQENKKKIVIELMRKNSDSAISGEQLISRCRSILGEDIEIEVILGDRMNLKAKFRPVISKLSMGEQRWSEAHGNLTLSELETL